MKFGYSTAADWPHVSRFGMAWMWLGFLWMMWIFVVWILFGRIGSCSQELGIWYIYFFVFICLFIYLFIWLFVYLFICVCVIIMLEWTNQVRHFNSVSIVAHGIQWQPWPWHPGLWALSNLRSWILTRSAASLSPRLVQIGPDCLRNPRGPQRPQREAQRRPQGGPLEIPGDSPDLSHRSAKPCEPSEPRPLFQVFMTIWYSQKMSLLVKAPLLQAARAAGPCLRPHPKHPGRHSPISPIDPYVSGGMRWINVQQSSKST
jgi:hypothetical protein